MGKEWDKVEFESFHARQVARLENQRARLLTYLDKTDDVEKKLALERLIMDIDMKLLTSLTKIHYNSISFSDQLRKQMNETAEEHKLEWRFTTLWELVKISQETRRDLDGIIRQVRKGVIGDKERKRK